MTLLSVLLALSAVEALALPPADVRLVRARGTAVTVLLDNSTEPARAQNGMALEAGDEVRTGASSTAEILFSSDTILSLRENSYLQIPDGQPYLMKGALLVKLKNLAGGAAFKVRTPTAAAAVRGTEFAVETAGQDSPTAIGVFDEGRVAASNGGGEVVLGPGQETTCAPGAPPSPPRPLAVLRRYRAVMRELKGRLAELQREYRSLPARKMRELRRGRGEEPR